MHMLIPIPTSQVGTLWVPVIVEVGPGTHVSDFPTQELARRERSRIDNLVEKFWLRVRWQIHIRQQLIPETELAASISRYLEDPSGPHQSGAVARHDILFVPQITPHLKRY
jgi:hypothetical protein